MSPGRANLQTNQRQLDADGCEVGVSRQALDETLAEYDAMAAALRDLEAALKKDTRQKTITGDDVEYHLDGGAMFAAINKARQALARAYD